MTDTRREPRTIYGAWVNYKDVVEIESAQAVCTAKIARIVARNGGGGGFKYRRQLALTDVYFTSGDALAALRGRLQRDLERHEHLAALLREQLQMDPVEATDD